MKSKLLIITTVAGAAGALGLAAQHYWLHEYQHEFWFHLLTHVLALIGSAGIVGLIFESFFRKHTLEDFAKQIRESFDGDPDLATSLSQEARQKRVKSTLEAQLGPDIGLAAYDVLVSRYLASPLPYRKEFFYEAVLSDFKTDVDVAPNLALKQDDYYKLTITQNFLRPFLYTANLQIGCILTDDFNEVNYWFSQSNCIFRDTLVLLENDRELVSQILDDSSTDEATLAAIHPILHLDKFSIDGIDLAATSAKVAPSGNSIGLQIRVPKALKQASNKPRLARYEIAVSGLIAKESRKYPVILGEPTQDPEITLRYQTNDITRIVAAPFFTGKYPFAPKIEASEDLRTVRVSFPRPGDDHAWVFPNSGAIFLWDRRPA